MAHGSYKTFLESSPPPKILSLHCRQINKVKHELDGVAIKFVGLYASFKV